MSKAALWTPESPDSSSGFQETALPGSDGEMMSGLVPRNGKSGNRQSNIGSNGDGSFGKSSDNSRRSQSSDGDAADEIKRERLAKRAFRAAVGEFVTSCLWPVL